MDNLQKGIAQVIGILLTLVGIVGFFTGDTLLMFGINLLHNIVHLITGLIGLYAGFYAAGKLSQAYNKLLGIIYILVAILGFISGISDFLVEILNIKWLITFYTYF